MPDKKKSKKRRIYLYIFLVIIIIAGVIFKMRYRAWFINLPEEPYNTPTTIDRVTLTPAEDFTNSRTISWRCDTMIQPAGVLLEERLKNDSLWHEENIKTSFAKVIQSRSGKGAYYEVKLKDLKNRIYRYKVFTGEDTTKYYKFEVKPLVDSMNFLFIGDVQDPVGTLTDSLFNKLRKTGPSADFIAMCGDQIEGPSDKFWTIWYNSLGSWQGNTPLIVSTGNHEYLKKGFSMDLDSRWVAQFGYPQNGPEGFKGRTYYIDFPLCRFIVLDSNDIVSISSISNHRRWLKKVLEQSNKKWNILMMHHALDCARDGRTNLVMHYFFKTLVLDSKIDLVLQGHDHSYARWNTYKEGKASTPIRIISVASPKMYPNRFDKEIDRLGSGLDLYQNIRIYRDSLVYQSFEFDNSIYDYITIHKDKADSLSIDDKAKNWEEKFNYHDFPKGTKGDKLLKEYEKEVSIRRMRKN